MLRLKLNHVSKRGHSYQGDITKVFNTVTYHQSKYPITVPHNRWVIIGLCYGLRPNWALIHSKPLPKPILCHTTTDYYFWRKYMTKWDILYYIITESFCLVLRAYETHKTIRLPAMLTSCFFYSLAQNTTWNRISNNKIWNLYVAFQLGLVPIRQQANV